jgi:putative transposase
VKKNYQTIDAAASALSAPPAVSVRIGEVIARRAGGAAGDGRRHWLQVMAAMFEEDVTAACGPKGKHDSDRMASRARVR